MTVEGVAPEQYQTRLAHIGVQLPDAQAGVFTLHVNETAVRMAADKLESAFKGALAPG